MIIEKESPCELVRLLLYLMLITICEEKGICEKTLKYGEEFETLLSYMEQHPQLWNEQRVANIGRDKVMNPDWLYPARLSCVRAALELSDREKAECFLRLLPWDKEYMIEQYYPLLDQWKEAYAALLPELLASLFYDSQYLLMQRLFLSEDPFLFHRCLKEIAHPYLLQQLIKKAFRSKYDLSILLDRMDLESWKQCISGVVKETSYTEIEFLWEAQEALRADYLLQKLWFKKLLLEKELSMGFLMKKALLETLEEYARCVLAFYEGQYQEFMLQEDFRYLLPSECRLSFVLLEALDFRKQGRLTETIRCLRMALQVDPQMTGVVREVIRILNLEIAHPAPAAGAEFEQLAVQMKAALRTMADNGQYSEAMQVLSQLLPLLPDDMELLKLQQRFLAGMKD